MDELLLTTEFSDNFAYPDRPFEALNATFVKLVKGSPDLETLKF